MSMPLSAWFSVVGEAHEGLAAVEEAREGDGEVLVDAREGLVELGARDLVDFLDGLLRVLDGLDQVLALGFEEAVTLGGFLVLLERHHVDRAHRFELLACRPRQASSSAASASPSRRAMLRLRAEFAGFDAEIADAGRFEVFEVGSELGGLCGVAAASLAQRHRFRRAVS